MTNHDHHETEEERAFRLGHEQRATVRQILENDEREARYRLIQQVDTQCRAARKRLHLIGYTDGDLVQVVSHYEKRRKFPWLHHYYEQITEADTAWRVATGSGGHLYYLLKESAKLAQQSFAPGRERGRNSLVHEGLHIATLDDLDGTKLREILNGLRQLG